MNPLALALAGRREDNAAHGGQVAHISAAEAGLLKSMGGAASINPVTGLPEYYTSGVSSGSPGVAATGQAPPGIGVSSGGPFGFSVAMGGLGGHGLGTAPGSPGPFGISPAAVAQAGLGGHGMSSGTTAGTGVTSAAAIANALAANPTMYGAEGPGSLGDAGPSSSSSGSGNFGIVTTTDGTPVTTTDGVPVMHGNLSGRVANTAIIPSDIANAHFFNNLGDSLGMLGDLGIPPISPTPPSLFSIPSAILGFFAQMASAQTAQNVANTRGAMALAGPGMGAPPAAFGGNPNTGTGHPMGLTYGGYSPPTTSGIARLLPTLQSVTPAPIEPEPVVSAAPVAPVTTLLQTDPREEGFSPSIQEIRRIFFESLA